MMRNSLSYLIVLLLVLAAPARAQVISIDMFTVQGNVKLKVLEAGTEKPVEFASVYLKAKNDTLITNFTLTDTTGLAKLEKVTRGTYSLTVEMMGYKPYEKEHYFNFSWNSEEKDLGTIHLEEDHTMLDAAHVSAIGNPIEIRQDTIIFNAASFQLGQNAMLEDLLKRMPGMEVGSDGTVKYNGETIKKITVGGRTFFFDDPKMALKNLPAQVVDKVKVIDKESDSEQFSGVATDREKVMDLEFKKEFQQGWFGNVKAGAGTTLAGDRKDEMVDDRGLLYNGNGMISGYSEKDQVVVVANAYNAPITNDQIRIVFRDEDGELSRFGAGGIQTYRQVGVNYNTTRLKGLESTGMASYSHSFRDARNRSERTTWIQNGSDIRSNSDVVNFTTDNMAKVSLELKNTDRSRYLFNFQPTIRFTGGKSEYYNDNSAREAESGTQLNSSKSSTYQESKKFYYSGGLEAGVRNLGDKRRNLTFTSYLMLEDFDADSRESSQMQRAADADPVTRNLFYLTDNRNWSAEAGLDYVEPLSQNWVLALKSEAYGAVRDNGREAFDRPDHTQRNDYYSTQSQNTYIALGQSAQFQYKKDRSSVQLGVRTQETLNETYTRSLGVETRTGQGEWLFDWSPFVNIRWSKQQTHLSFNYNGRFQRPSNARLLPVLDISVPTRLQTGNIYLKPSYRHNASTSVYFNDSANQRYVSLSVNGTMTLRPIVTASWFDSDGIRYSIPVNSRKPAIGATSYGGFGFSLSGDKRLTLDCFYTLSYERAVSYQSIKPVSGLNVDSFDYMQFMGWFWGGASGSRFYEGVSGFGESMTRSLMFGPEVNLLYKSDAATLAVGYGTTLNVSSYSLDPTANTRTWIHDISGSAEWVLPHDWELETDAGYHFYQGFPEGYNDPYLRWDASVTKNIKAWAISFRVDDILNSSRNKRHITTENYVEDVMQNQLGRRIILSVKWNFGKLNAAKSRNATNASLRMMY